MRIKKIYQLDELDYLSQTIALGIATILFFTVIYFISMAISNSYKEVFIEWLT